MDRRVRVGIDNDFPVVVMGLAAMLRAHQDRFEIVDLENDGALSADIVLKDAFALNEDLGIYVASTPAKVVVFASTDDQAAVDATLEKGAAGFVHKGLSVEELVEALERVQAGDNVVVLTETADQPVRTHDWPGRGDGLTERESEVLSLICRGLSNQQVAGALYLSINSVKTYIRQLYRKIGAESRSQAVIWGLQHGFTPHSGRPQGRR